EPQPHTVRNATALVARLVTNAAIAPNIQDATQTLRSLVANLKPLVLQAPKANDAAVRQALSRNEKICKVVVHVGETANELNIIDADSPVVQFQWQLQELYDFLQVWETKLKMLLRWSYRMKLANQDEITQQLSKHNQELTDLLSQLQVCN
ncbi:hypothetical protein FRC07_003093, partial [Ceratobasidium sp. 392]